MLLADHGSKHWCWHVGLQAWRSVIGGVQQLVSRKVAINVTGSVSWTAMTAIINVAWSVFVCMNNNNKSQWNMDISTNEVFVWQGLNNEKQGDEKVISCRHDGDLICKKTLSPWYVHSKEEQCCGSWCYIYYCRWQCHGDLLGYVRVFCQFHNFYTR